MVYLGIDRNMLKSITDYMGDPMTATVITDRRKSKRNREMITAEIIYYQMTALSIPFECQKWHLNRLLMLIRVCGIKNSPDDKMSAAERNQSNAELNAQRQKQFNTKG